MKKKKGFTLVELLAVIVILAVILIIAVPRITDVINNSKKASFEASAKTIASQAEKKYMEQQVLGNTDTISCSDIANINSTDYASCTITFDESGNALVSITGSGKFDGLVINNATKNSATTTELIVTDSKYFSYEDVEGGISITDYNIGYNVDVTVKDQSKCESYLTSDDQGYSQEEATTMCTGGDLDGWTLKDAVQQGQILSPYYEMAGIEVKWLDVYVDGGGEDVVIPSEIDGKKVVAISANAFGNKGIKSVVIPDGVTSINKGVFEHNQLTSVNIPSSVTTIGDSAFEYNQLTSVNIPSSVTTIGAFAFRSNELTSIVIPESVTSIGDYAFSLNQLTSVNIPSSVTTIGAFAFESNQLTSIVIPESVTSIGDYAFSYNQLTSVNIPSSVTTIGALAFESNQLTSIEIPESVTSIGRRAFEISCSTDSCVNSVCTCIKVGGNANLSKIVNKTGKAFDWDLIINNSSKGRYTFVTGDVVSDNKENHIVSIVSE